MAADGRRPSPGGRPRFLRTSEAARFVGLSAKTLEKHRCYGTGPSYRELGGRIVYALDDLKSWVDRGLRTSTSDPGSGTVLPPRRVYNSHLSRALWMTLHGFVDLLRSGYH